MEKLASGLKINRGGDDASNLAVSEKLRSQIRGLNRAQKEYSKRCFLYPDFRRIFGRIT